MVGGCLWCLLFDLRLFCFYLIVLLVCVFFVGFVLNLIVYFAYGFRICCFVLVLVWVV